MDEETLALNYLNKRLADEQLDTHYQQLPVVIIAPALGAIFTAWVLWDAVNLAYLQIGLGVILSISLLRVFIYKRYFKIGKDRTVQRRWRWISISTAFLSGSIWGSAAIFLYPPLLVEYEIYMLVLLALIPVVPLAALAVFMPAFYAYYLPSILPFIITLGMQDSRGEVTTALLLLMMMGATLTFAKKYSNMLSEAILLRLQLDDKKQALEKADILKTRLLASASHDLRQPVHALGLFVEALRSRLSGLDKGNLLKNIEEATLNLRIMLDGMLDISRLDTEVVEINRQHFWLNDLLDNIREEYEPQIIQKGLKFHYFCPRLCVNSDPILLERILRNLLSNAIKFTSNGGVLLGCRKYRGRVRIQVRDTGCGIPEEQINDVFLEFTQLQNAERNSIKGLGLGLSIIKRLCHLMAHEIIVNSQLGSGSTFSIILPQADKTLINNENNHLRVSENKPLNNLLSVVIDDNETVLDAMQVLIREWGGKVIVGTSAESVKTSLKKLKQYPDLLILDYCLAKDKIALDAIKWLRPEVKHNTPTIIITGDTAPNRIKQAHNAGYLLLHKPVDPDQLKVCISELLEDIII